jgi:hypothetical protein
MLNVEAFRQQLRRQGEQVRWLKALPCDCYDPRQNHDAQRGCTRCDHGQVYRDQGLVWALVGNLKRGMLHPDLGWLDESTVTITTMPDEAMFGTFDKIVLAGRVALQRARLHRGEDLLPHLYPVEVKVIADGDTVYVEGTDYTVDVTTRLVTWLTDGPANIYAAEYTARPIYWFAGQELRPPRPAHFGTAQTPMRGLLSLTPPEA